jgi:hypothetical protein
MDNASRDVKKNVPVYKEIEEGVSRPVRETFKWIENNPDKAAIIAGVIVVGWAACVDGCTFVAGIVVDGSTVGASGGAIAIPIVATTFGGPEKSPPRSGGPEKSAPPPSTAEPKQDQKPVSGSDKDVLTPNKIYPKYYSEKEYPSPGGMKNAIPKVGYRSLSDKFTDAILHFSYPSQNAVPRIPTEKDPAGGIFTSPRSDLVPKDAETLYGKGNARRMHGAQTIF